MPQKLLINRLGHSNAFSRVILFRTSMILSLNRTVLNHLTLCVYVHDAAKSKGKVETLTDSGNTMN